MKRADFIKNLGLSSGGLLLPKNLLTKNQVKIYDNYVRGLQHYHFQNVEKKIKKGDILSLKREKTNVHDAFAVEVYYKNNKIGYLPAFENIVIANMLDAQVKVSAFVSHYKKEDNPYKMESLGIAIYTELIVPTPTLITEFKGKRANDIEDIYRKGYNI